MIVLKNLCGGASAHPDVKKQVVLQPEGPAIETPTGYYPVGTSVKVRLSNETEGIEMRYTTEGSEPKANSTPYEGPFAVSTDTVVRAAGFEAGKQLGETAKAQFQFIKAGDVEMIPSVDSDPTSPGLAYRFFDEESQTMPDFDSLKPAETSVAKELSIESVGRGGDKFSLLMEGHIEIGAAGVYNLHVGTAKADACRVIIDGRRIVDNGLEDFESVALAGLDKGKHALRVEFLDNGWGEYIRISLRELDEEQKQAVIADMLSH
jgi:hypothetical protein